MRTLLFTLLFYAPFILLAQKPKITWSDEFKMRKGTTDLTMAHADETGIYVQEEHLAMKSFHIIGANVRGSATLVKLNKSFQEEYRNDFNKELKGKDFYDFFFLNKKMWMLASAYNKREGILELYACEIDKRDGNMKAGWKHLSTLKKDEKRDDLNFQFSYNSDSTKMILVSTVEGKEKSAFEVEEFDDTMKKIGKTTKISTNFEAKTFQLQDVIYASNGNVMMIGKEYAFAEGKKKKSKFLEFQNYSIQLYNGAGQLIKEINTEIDGKWLLSTKVAQVHNKELVLAAFYSNQKKGKEMNGMLVQRINPNTGDIISSSQKPLNASLLAEQFEGDEEETKQEQKEREKLEKMRAENEAFSKYMRFRNFIYTPENGLVIIAEKFNYYYYITTTPNPMPGGGMSTSTTYNEVYECGDIMVSKMNANGDLEWLQVIPKNQREVLTRGRVASSFSFNPGTNYFSVSNYPFFAGIGSIYLKGNNSLAILFNDNPKNESITRPEQRPKYIQNFGRSNCMAVIMDLSTGKFTKQSLFSNRDQPTAMPRLGVPVGKDFYIIGKDEKLMGKSRIAVGKISF